MRIRGYFLILLSCPTLSFSLVSTLGTDHTAAKSGRLSQEMYFLTLGPWHPHRCKHGIITRSILSPDRYVSRKFHDKEIYIVRNTGKSLVFDLESSCYFTVWLY